MWRKEGSRHEIRRRGYRRVRLVDITPNRRTNYFTRKHGKEGMVSLGPKREEQDGNEPPT